jgi:uroporphyrin-3 C-methyltransferase
VSESPKPVPAADVPPGEPPAAAPEAAALRGSSAEPAQAAPDALPPLRGPSFGPRALAVLRARLDVLALGVGVAGLLAALLLWQRAEGIGEQAARRLQEADLRAAQLEGQVRQSQDLARDLQSRAGVLEGKLTEALGRQAQLETLYRTMSQDALDSVLAEVENALAIASQQLVVSGNVQGALVALADADGRLARIRQPQAIGLRRLIQRDMERLKGVPAVDIVGLAIRLDAVAGTVDQLPLLASAATPAGQGAAEPAPRAGGFSLQSLASSGRRGLDALFAELSQLFRVNRVDTPDALLLAPEQQYFVRQNLRMTLLAARLSLLARLEPVFRADLERAVGLLGSHYDREQRSVAGAVAALRQLQTARIAPELPSLGDALVAVRAARSALENNP